MKQFNYSVPNIDALKNILNSKKIRSYCNCKSYLIQIYSANNNNELYFELAEAIHYIFPSAVVVGASSVGEILDGLMHTDTTLVSFTFFESSSVQVFSYSCQPGKETEAGNALVDDIQKLTYSIKGILLLSTPVSNDSTILFNTITSHHFPFPIFGGGAGDYANKRKTLVFDGQQCFAEGAVAVVFSGDKLHIEALTYLGWNPLSKEMTITETDGMSVKTVDGKPAFSIYEKYLGLEIQNSFFQNVLEFPFLVHRDGQVIARVPFFVNEKDRSIQFLADVRQGEKFRIGYGNPQNIIAESVNIQQSMSKFKPDAIFLYTSICRRFLMQKEVNLETLPFNNIAPTSGFYTFGEFYANRQTCSLLNSTMVAVGFREGDIADKDDQMASKQLSDEGAANADPYDNQHARIISRLLYFINVTIQEVEAQNKLLQILINQKNEFLGIAAHDLKNPIGAIQGLSELLADVVADEHKRHIKLINKTSTGMLGLINNILDLARIEAGTLELKRNDTDYIGFLTQSIYLNEFAAKNKNIKFETNFDTLTYPLSIDVDRMEQVLNNLIGNAIKYSFADTTITINVYTKNNSVVTEVADQGQGIPANELKFLFTAFKKASVRPTAGENSHGLGLAIVKRIVEAHGGQVGVTSQEGKGSVFYFALPIV